jgi:thiol-disulfide isomerase/thioredoxin
MTSAPAILLLDAPMGLFLLWVALTVALVVIGVIWFLRPDDAGVPFKRVAVTWLAATIVILVVSIRIFGHDGKRAYLSPPAPNFALQTLDGESYSLQNLHGKVALIEFWASWCGPCRESLPEMVRLYKEFGSRKRFVMIGVSEDEDQTKFEDFIAQNGIRWHQHWDPQGTLADRFGTNAVPSYAVIDGDGRLRFLQKGYTSDTFLRLHEAISQALGPATPVADARD